MSIVYVEPIGTKIVTIDLNELHIEDTDVLMLATNMIRKDLSSTNQYEAGLTLSSLSCFLSSDLARDLANDIMTLLTSTKPYLRSVNQIKQLIKEIRGFNWPIVNYTFG